MCFFQMSYGYITDTSTHTSSHHISKRVGRGCVERQDRKSLRRRKGQSLSTAYMVNTLMYFYRTLLFMMDTLMYF